ncbi:2-isopropylmalate synthase [Streptomyces collinus]|uniref:2-isopropylmalate synthase n=1 Tax=Streptomyces collinus TaxID=42684 RepID=UPI00343DFD7B
MAVRHTPSDQLRQLPSGMPTWRYDLYPPVVLPDRAWPGRTLDRAPMWCAVDLRDGNQALPVPMDLDRKRQLFDLQVGMGFKEIEVGFPAASKTDFDFVRLLIEEDLVPDDVAIQVIMPAREELIRRTYESLRGVRRAVVHLYHSTSCLQREVVFGMTRDQVRDLAVRSTELAVKLALDMSDSCIQYEYTPESFTGTELDFALEISNAVASVWGPGPDAKMILNLPATVEMSTPNVYADQIEFLHRNLERRKDLVLSIHPHNDRGTAVAAAELACLAGAERIEGCLFGNGERTGNVDLVTLGLNLFTQGVDPMIDFSDLGSVAATVEHCNRLPVHPRHPYAGELVHTAFSGSHQDAVKKGFESMERQAAVAGKPVSEVPWAVPYLPIDPRDIGRDYEAVIRVNSQSGKAGAAYLLRSEYHLDLPRPLQIEFAGTIQQHTDATGEELSVQQIWTVFEREYLRADAPIELLDHRIGTADGDGSTSLECTVSLSGEPRSLRGRGEATPGALLDGLVHAGLTGYELRHFAQHSLTSVDGSRFAAYVQVAHQGRTTWGVGIDTDPDTAALRAVVGGVNRLRPGPAARQVAAPALQDASGAAL